MIITPALIGVFLFSTWLKVIENDWIGKNNYIFSNNCVSSWLFLAFTHVDAEEC